MITTLDEKYHTRCVREAIEYTVGATVAPTIVAPAVASCKHSRIAVFVILPGAV
jgi:hypothetical protein